MPAAMPRKAPLLGKGGVAAASADARGSSLFSSIIYQLSSISYSELAFLSSRPPDKNRIYGHQNTKLGHEKWNYGTLELELWFLLTYCKERRNRKNVFKNLPLASYTQAFGSFLPF
jgi:hypothetical protein